MPARPYDADPIMTQASHCIEGRSPGSLIDRQAKQPSRAACSQPPTNQGTAPLLLLQVVMRAKGARKERAPEVHCRMSSWMHRRGFRYPGSARNAKILHIFRKKPRLWS